MSSLRHPYSHAIESRISNPASSIAVAMRCHVRVPPNASRYPPGFNTRQHSRHISTSYAIFDPSHAFPIKPTEDRLVG